MSWIMVPAIIGSVIILGFALIGIFSFIAIVGVVIFETISVIFTTVPSNIHLQWIVITIAVMVFTGIAVNRIQHIRQRYVDHRKIDRRHRICSVCSGAGGSGEYTSSENPCDTCNGRGTLSEILSNATFSCKYCNGSGMINPGKFYLSTCSCVLENWEKKLTSPNLSYF